LIKVVFLYEAAACLSSYSFLLLLLLLFFFFFLGFWYSEYFGWLFVRNLMAACLCYEFRHVSAGILRSENVSCLKTEICSRPPCYELSDSQLILGSVTSFNMNTFFLGQVAW
jgi:hypothetical protein